MRVRRGLDRLFAQLRLLGEQLDAFDDVDGAIQLDIGDLFGFFRAFLGRQARTEALLLQLALVLLGNRDDDVGRHAVFMNDLVARRVIFRRRQPYG